MACIGCIPIDIGVDGLGIPVTFKGIGILIGQLIAHGEDFLCSFFHRIPVVTIEHGTRDEGISRATCQSTCSRLLHRKMLSGIV